MKVGIIDYEGGNLASVASAVEHLGFNAFISSDPKELIQADKIIFPGVGAAGATMDALKTAGLIDFIKTDLKKNNIPCLGICIGIQVLFEHSEEDNMDTLGIIEGNVVRFPEREDLKVPHIGWNQVHFTQKDHPLMKGINEKDFFYFVNSYYVVPKDQSIILGHTQYRDVQFTTLVEHDNWVASQFHLEKSGEAGLKLLKNFLSLPCPSNLN